MPYAGQNIHLSRSDLSYSDFKPAAFSSRGQEPNPPINPNDRSHFEYFLWLRTSHAPRQVRQGTRAAAAFQRLERQARSDLSYLVGTDAGRVPKRFASSQPRHQMWDSCMRSSASISVDAPTTEPWSHATAYFVATSKLCLPATYTMISLLPLADSCAACGTERPLGSIRFVLLGRLALSTRGSARRAQLRPRVRRTGCSSPPAAFRRSACSTSRMRRLPTHDRLPMDVGPCLARRTNRFRTTDKRRSPSRGQHPETEASNCVEQRRR